MTSSKAQFSKWELDRWKKHGILGCGFEDGYHDGEIFMRYVVMPETFIDNALHGKEEVSIEDLKNLNFVHSNPLAQLTVYERIFMMCVENGFFFESFLDACRDTGAMDKWFMSDYFMDNVYAGSIHGRWHIRMQGEKNLDLYHERFRKFIRDLDERLDWTNKYLEENPDSFWPKRKVYWKD